MALSKDTLLRQFLSEVVQFLFEVVQSASNLRTLSCSIDIGDYDPYEVDC